MIRVETRVSGYFGVRVTRLSQRRIFGQWKGIFGKLRGPSPTASVFALSIPDRPILVLSDNGIFMPKETLVTALQSGHPLELVTKVANMLFESTHVRNDRDHKIQD